MFRYSQIRMFKRDVRMLFASDQVSQTVGSGIYAGGPMSRIRVTQQEIAVHHICPANNGLMENEMNPKTPQIEDVSARICMPTEDPEYVGRIFGGLCGDENRRQGSEAHLRLKLNI